jgi:very-short-patch-repair endonuclease
MTRKRAGTGTARALRRRETDAERMLWLQLRDRRLGGAKFRRQHPVGDYVADFACPERRLVVELDGSQHMEQETADAERTAALFGSGFRVLRFWDNEVLTAMQSVLERILEEIEATAPEDTLVSRGRRGGRT